MRRKYQREKEREEMMYFMKSEKFERRMLPQLR
jgi:hypothetical protein